MGSRYILALVLMLGVMVVWSIIFGNRFTPEQDGNTNTEQSTPLDTPEDGTPEEIDIDPIESNPIMVVQDSPDDPMVTVKTATYNITFNEKLAIAKKWELIEKKPNGELQFPDRSGDDNNIPLNLIPERALHCLAIRIGNTNLQIDLSGASWQVDKPEGIILSETKQADTLTFSTVLSDQLKISKVFTFYYNSYTVDLVMKFENVLDDGTPLLIGGNEPWDGYELRWGPGINADLLIHEKTSGKRGRRGSEGARTYIGTGKPTRELKDELALATVLWAGIKSQYFSAIMIPDPNLEATYMFDFDQSNEIGDINIAVASETAVLKIPRFQLTTQQEISHSFRLYVGPKDDVLLREIAAPNDDEIALHLPKMIDFGFFSPIAWGMLWVMKKIYAIFGNYGLAIILLTALVKIISFPLTRKAHVSMKKMQDLQPELTELREKYRDDPQKLNKASMRLYKENGVNPLGGCIPWLPQIPIFWALFALLGSAVELRGAPFLLWIDDLSAPDTLIALPFSINLLIIQIDAVRFLPILNGVTTWLQQKFVGGMSATPATTNTQAKLMQFLPIIFIFIFYNWASGFVLYWLCNNVFTVAQQYIQTNYFHDGETVTKENTSKRKSK